MNIKVFTLLIVLTSIVFFVNNKYFGGYLNNPETLAAEIWSHPDSLLEAKYRNVAPFKYRILFDVVLDVSNQALNTNRESAQYFNIFKFWSFIFLLSSVFAFYYLLKHLGFSTNLCVLGILLYLFSPSLIMGYSLPVHIREDTLGYTLLCLGMIGIIKENFTWIVVASILGILCRETLLILPLAYLFSNASLTRKVVPLFISISGFLAIRIFMGFESYAIFEMGLVQNIKNIYESISFTFVSFHFMWLPFLIYTYKYYTNDNYRTSIKTNFVIRSAPIAVLVIIVTTFFGGLINDLRLLFLAFPWIIVIFLRLIEEKAGDLRIFASKKVVRAYFLGSSAIVGIVGVLLSINLEVETKHDAVPIQIWIIVFLLFSSITVITAPLNLALIDKKVISG